MATRYYYWHIRVWGHGVICRFGIEQFPLLSKWKIVSSRFSFSKKKCISISVWCLTYLLLHNQTIICHGTWPNGAKILEWLYEIWMTRSPYWLIQIKKIVYHFNRLSSNNKKWWWIIMETIIIWQREWMIIKKKLKIKNSNS